MTIYDETSAHLLLTPSRPLGVEDTQLLPVVQPSPQPRTGADDDLVERTWNGLRPEDAALEQPPQWSGWFE